MSPRSLPPFAAVLLAGGRSRRMGMDKGRLDWQGQPLWQVQLAKLAALQPEPLLLAARDGQSFATTEATVLHDPPGEDLGPLPAIARCLRSVGRPLLVLAVDMPMMTSDFIRAHLLGSETPALPSTASIGLAYVGEPLCALYTPAMLPLIEIALASGQRSLQRLWAHAAEQGVAQLIALDDTQRAFFHNMNTPEDLRAAEPNVMQAASQSSDTRITLTRIASGQAEILEDHVACEEPLEISVEGRSVAVVMRTPGHDRELAAGFLVSEGVVQKPRDILEISQCPSVGDAKGNIVDVLLGGATVDWASLTRHVFSASSCGLCGKTSIDAIFQRFSPVHAEWKVVPALIASLPDKLRAEQATFSKTGGLHACALFDLAGHLIVVREDVGRHNALDKVLGYGLLHDLLPFNQHILLLSGRVSFEMIQKALAGGIAIVAAISAPSSLAIEFAQEAGQTLIGFLRGQTMNVYTHGQRVAE